MNEDYKYYNLSNKYEAFPTKTLQTSLLLLLTDDEEILQLRLRSYMALIYQYKNNNLFSRFEQPIWKYGVDTILNLTEEYNNKSITTVFVNVMLTCIPSTEISSSFIRHIVRLIGADNLYKIVEDTKKYIIERNVYLVLLKECIKFVLPRNKIDIADLLFKHKSLTTDICEYILLFEKEIGIELYDFLANLPVGEFPQYNLIGRHGILKLNTGQQVSSFDTGNQSVHQLDFHRSTFLEWLVKASFVEEKKNNTFIINNWINTRYDKFGEIINTLKTKNNIFIGKNGPLTFEDIFRRIVFIIINHKFQNQLEKRLLEECTEMKETCVSGHFNRLFNTFVGFIPEINIVDNAEKYKSLMRSLLNTRLKQSYYEGIEECIIMAEWTPEYKTKFENLCLQCHLETLDAISETSSQRFPNGEDENELYTDLVYKFSGLK